YSFSTWGDTNPGIGVARSERPDGPFTDTGKILDTASSGVPNSIDPFYFQTGSGQRYLFWGSFNGIYGQEIAPDMRTLTGAKFKIAGNAFEATYIYEKDGKFWFFGSNGTCCEGADSKYHLSVAVADTIAGPYKTKDGKNILNNGQEGTPFLHGDSNTGWVGPGHNAEIIRDDNGRYFILYHAIASKNPLLPNGGATRRPLMMDEIIWGNDNWPTIAGGLPSSTPRQAPYFKN
ncbi:MAG: family 43 glycosylhydrolase, partial [Dysgonamonadaceae bacterium]|nr:family 43 glycosylhydrolase [Dysgonamonadaceae bacterium]